MHLESLFISLLISWFINNFRLATAQATTAPPILKVGNYTILGCGAQNYALKSLLDRIFASLQDVFESIDSADYGGTPAYNAFLKGVDPDDVKSFFEKIAKGVYIQIPGDQSAAPPGMLCVDSSQKELYDLFCRGARLGGSTGFGAAICPSFFDLPVIPTFDMCPGLIVRGSAFGAAPALIQTQQTILQTVFIETYLNDQTRGHVLNPVVEDLNSVRTLSPAQARINYPNYAWYLDFMVAGCKQFPNSAPTMRRLTETDGIQMTDLVANVPLRPGCPSGSIQALAGNCKPTS